jgi:hypothetical protein
MVRSCTVTRATGKKEVSTADSTVIDFTNKGDAKHGGQLFYQRQATG